MAWGDGGDAAARAADLFARNADLALPPALRPVLARRLRRRRRADLVAYWVAIVAGLTLSLAGVAWGGGGSGPGRGLGGGIMAILLATVVVGLLALAAGCLGAWALIELTVRAVVRARPATTDVQSLAFDDALRADAVRRLLGTASILPFVVGLVVTQAGLRPAGTALVVLYAAGLVALSLLGERGGARAHYRRRLWPTARA